MRGAKTSFAENEMGKRRRNSSSKRERGNPISHPRSKAPGRLEREKDDDANGERAPSIDIDEDCVQYESGPEQGNIPQAQNGQKFAKEKKEGMVPMADSDSDEGGTSEEDLEMGVADPDESDAEVELEFFDPTDGDVTPTAIFLEKFTYECAGTTKESSGKRKVVEARDLATAICKQMRVGTMVRVTDEEAPIGFISCLNLHVHRKLLEPIVRSLVVVCGEKTEHARFRQILERAFNGGKKFESGKMGLILCERVVNLPPQIVPKMLEALFCEIEWAVEDEPTQEEREAFRLGWYLYITEVYSSVAGAEKAGEREAKRQKGDEEDDEVKMAFTRVEDEAWFKHAACHITWDVVGSEAEKGGYRRRRMAMIIGAGRIGKVREMVEGIVGGLNESAENGNEEMKEGDIGS